MSTTYQLHFILDGKEFAYRGGQSQVPQVDNHVVLGKAVLYKVTGLHWRFDIERDGPTRVAVDIFIQQVPK